MPRLLLVVALAALAVVGGVLGLLVSPLWLLAVPPAVVAAVGAGLGLDLDRFLQAVDDGGDAGAGPAGLHP
ncbi:MAG: hypothetical protein JWO60_3234 [Frankiales bacterium]|nr:hypothetical protein [Frankiales bacterium]